MAEKKHSILGQEENVTLLELAVKNDMPVLLIGDTGTGKTTMVREQGGKVNKKVLRFSITGETTVDEFIGKYVLEHQETVWKDGILLTAMKEGHWLVVDEVNAALPEILFVLHSLLDDDKAVTVTSHESEVVKPHKDFRFFATMNPVEEYSGTKDLNKAFLSRFPMILHVDYPAQSVEVEILKQQAGADAKTATVISEAAVRIRRAKRDNQIFYTCSTRDLIQWAKLAKEIGLGQAFKVTIGSKSRADEKIIAPLLRGVVEGFERLEKGHGVTCMEEIEKRAEALAQERRKFTEEKAKMREMVIKDLMTQFVDAGVIK